jgi:hypothetical protein
MIDDVLAITHRIMNSPYTTLTSFLHAYEAVIKTNTEQSIVTDLN